MLFRSYGTGDQTRDYTYVDDAVRAYLLLGVTPNIEGTTINFGTGVEIRIRDLAKMILEITGSKSKLKLDHKLRSGETPRLLCKPNKAKRTLDWKAEVNFKSSMIKTAEYYKTRKHLISNIPFML